MSDIQRSEQSDDDIVSATLRQLVAQMQERIAEEVTLAVEERGREGTDAAIGAMRERMMEMEARMEERTGVLEDAMERRAQAIEESMRRKFESLEERVQGLEQRQPEGGGADATSLEERMAAVEASLQRALSSMMPKVDALVEQLRRGAASAEPPSPDASPSPAAAHMSPAARRRLGAGLVQAAKDGRLEDARALLRAGANVDARDDLRMTPLLHAAVRPHPDVVALLLSWGADVGAEHGNGRTAMHYAAAHDRSGLCTNLLIDAGAPLEGRDRDGFMPLHSAALMANEEAVKVLLAAGADKRARDNAGKTPVEVAVSDGVRRLLRR